MTLLDKTLETLKRGQVTRKELVTILSRINQGKHECPELDEELTLDQTHQEQGRQWLMDLWRTPLGKERSNNPFYEREQDILGNYSHITMRDWYNAGNSYRNYYIPMYTVYSKNGNAFDYVVVAGKCKIVG